VPTTGAQQSAISGRVVPSRSTACKSRHVDKYLDGLAAVGFVDATVRFTHQAADGMHGAIIKATKPR
jgi:hypothetical protein